MANNRGTALQAKEKAEAPTRAEQTRPEPVFSPAVDIFETDKEIGMLIDLPGVKSSDLNIDLNDKVLTIDGDVKSPEGTDEASVLREYRTGKYYREFTLSQIIDQGKIEAELRDGVLRLKLPKVEEATPRKIKVKSS